MSPSQPRAPRLAVRIEIAALLVALAAAVSPLVVQAAAGSPLVPLATVSDPDVRPDASRSGPLTSATRSITRERIPLYPLVMPSPDPGLPAPGQFRLLGPTSLLLASAAESPHVVDGLASDGCAFCHRASSASEGSLTVAPYRAQALKPAAEAYLGTEFSLCFQCHSETPFIDSGAGGTAFLLHDLHLGGVTQPGSGGLEIGVPGDGQGNAICAECHFRLHSTAAEADTQLVNFAPNVLPRGGSLTWTGAGSQTCTLTCHGVSHRAAGYEPAAVQNAALGVDARITVSTSGANLVDDSRTFTVTVEKDDGTGGGWMPAVGIAVDPSAAGVGGIIGGSCNNSAPDTNTSGQCTIIVNSSATGTSTINATAVVEVEGVVGPISVPVSTTGHGAHDISNTVIWVDARITIGPSATDLVPGGPPHTFTVTVERDDGTGWAVVAGVNVLGSATGEGSITGGSCDNTDGDTELDGTCTIVVSSTAAGTLSVDATATIVVSGVAITRSASGSATWVAP